MKVNQISSLLNDVFGEILGETALVEEDLRNLVSAGQLITASDTFGPNFENYAGKIVDKVGRTVFWDRGYRAKDLGIWRDYFEYGSVLEKIRVDIGDYEDNCEWDLTKDLDNDGDLDYNENLQNHIEELFKFVPAKTRAKYFNMKTTFKTVISITRKQLKSAFDSATAMARFIGMIENRISSKMEIAKEELQRRAVGYFMANKIAASSNVVNLAQLYKDATGLQFADMGAALNDPDALRFIAKSMTLDREFMTQPSTIYSHQLDESGNVLSSPFYNHTPIQDSRLIVLADLDAGLKFNLYGDTYNEEFVKLDNYKTVPFWQGTGTTMDIEDRSSIKIRVTDDSVPDSGDGVVEQANILGVLFDRDGIMCCNEDPEVRSQYNADGNFTNFFYCYDASYYNDLDENGIVYIWGDVV